MVLLPCWTSAQNRLLDYQVLFLTTNDQLGDIREMVLCFTKSMALKTTYMYLLPTSLIVPVSGLYLDPAISIIFSFARSVSTTSFNLNCTNENLDYK